MIALHILAAPHAIASISLSECGPSPLGDLALLFIRCLSGFLISVVIPRMSSIPFDAVKYAFINCSSNSLLNQGYQSKYRSQVSPVANNVHLHRHTQ